MVTIPARFNGPPHSGNGGYCCGLVADHAGQPGPMTVTLRQPPPLDTPLAWETTGPTVRMVTAGGAIVAEAVPGDFTREPLGRVTDQEATAGMAAYPGFVNHPFGHCFTCGTMRDEGDGLRIFTGPISPGSAKTAAAWTPQPGHADADGKLTVPIAWAAIDCAGGWAADFTKHPTVLGRMTGQISRLPEVGESCVVIGTLIAHEGRKFITDTALYAADELLARAEQTWIEIDPAAFG